VFSILNFQYRIGKKLSPLIKAQFAMDSINLIIGNNGEGKSLLFRSLVGQNKINSGEIIYNDTPLEIHRLPISFCPTSDYFCNDLKIDQYFGYLSTITHIDEIKLRHLIRIFGINKHLQTRISNLSEGEKRRLSIIETELMESPLCFHDEPDANLDISYREEWIKFLNQNKKGKIRLIITHYPHLYTGISEKIFEINKDHHIAIRSINEEVKA